VTGPERVQKTGSRPRTRKRVAALLAAAGATVLLAACGSSGKGPITLNWYVFPEPSGSFQAAATECSQGSHSAYNIRINFLSTSSDQQRVSLVRRLAANDSSIDILAMDVDWTAEFATAKWLKPVPASVAAQIRSQDLAGPVQTATWQNRLWAVPINSNTELLWYRKDLVPNPPTTWRQMIADANQLAAKGKAHYIEEQGAQYEGLTVWFNSMVNSAGGQILASNNKVVLGASALKAAEIMKELATSKGADPSLNVSMEGPGQVAFQNGTAAFMINYPFVWSATMAGNPKVFKDMGYAYFPQVTPGIAPKVSIGGYNLGISAFSKPPNLAFQAVQCLTQVKNQSRDAIKGGLAPVAASIYDQPAFEKAYPFHQLIKQQLQTYGLRPQTPAYADVTLAIQKTLSPTSNINPKTVVSTLRNEIKLSLSSSALL
jgi:multiple sugar transport system substrate-binding protein